MANNTDEAAFIVLDDPNDVLVKGEMLNCDEIGTRVIDAGTGNGQCTVRFIQPMGIGLHILFRRKNKQWTKIGVLLYDL